jgi:hypothetical protein
MSFTFAGGIRDGNAERGFVPVALEVIAVDLKRGTVLWRRSDAGRPLAATARWLLTTTIERAKLMLHVLDAASGSEHFAAAVPRVPEWAHEALGQGNSENFTATELDQDRFRVVWTLRRLYRGGASPSSFVQAEAQREASGAFVVDAAHRIVTEELAVGAAAVPEPDAEGALTAAPDAESGVIASARVGDRVFVMTARPDGAGGTSASLLARDAGSGATQWEIPLASIAPRRAGPLRK